MAAHAYTQAQGLKLPSIAEKLAQLERIEPVHRLQTYNELPNPQHLSSHFVQPALENANFNAALPSPGNAVRSSIGGDYTRPVIGRRGSRPTSYCRSSASDDLFSQLDSGPSTASTSPSYGPTPRTSRASSLTPPCLSDELFDNNDGLVISSAHIEWVYKQLEEVFKNAPAERASNPKDQHKMDEQRRRAIHKKLYEVHESISDPVLVRLQDPNTNCYQEGLPPQLVKAMMTGNHKKHRTKTAILIAHLVQSLHQGRLLSSLMEENGGLRERAASQVARITSLEEENGGLREQNSVYEEEIRQLCDMLETAGISSPAIRQSSYLPSQTTKRQRSFRARECQRT